MADTLSRYALPDPVKARFMAWWSWLQDENASGTARADRATLRRAHDLGAVARTSAYQRIYRELVEAHGGADWAPWQQERLAALIGLAAHVKTRSPQSLPEAMSEKPKGQDRNPVSELRFARLLDAPDIEALFTGLRRLLPLIGNTTDPAALANDVFGWGDETKKRWAYAYRWPAKT